MKRRRRTSWMRKRMSGRENDASAEGTDGGSIAPHDGEIRKGSQGRKSEARC